MFTMTSKNQKLPEIRILLGFLVCFIGLQIGNGYSQSDCNQYWLSCTANKTKKSSPQITLLNADQASIKFKIEVSGVYIREFNDQQHHYQMIALPECGFMDSIGQPMMPKITKLVAIPSACTRSNIKLKLHSSKIAVFNDYQINPVPKLVERIRPDGEFYFIEQFNNDPTTYSTNDFYPHEIIKVEKIGYIRDQKAIWLAIYPIQYNPVTQEIKVYHQMEISLNHCGGSVFSENGLGPLEEFKDELFINYDHSTKHLVDHQPKSGNVTFPTNLTNPGNTADYLIITTDELCSNSALDSLARHRAEFSGFDVVVVKTGDVYQQFPNSTKDESIKDFITHVYNYWLALHIGDGHLGYVLFIGEGTPNSTNVIPTHFYQRGYSKAVSDYWYACISDDNEDGTVNDDDVIADIIIGRFSLENHQELNVIVRKTIEYEKSLLSNEFRRRKITLVNGFVLDEFNDNVRLYEKFHFTTKLL